MDTGYGEGVDVGKGWMAGVGLRSCRGDAPFDKLRANGVVWAGLADSKVRSW